MATFAVRMIHGPHWDPARGTRDQDDEAAIRSALSQDPWARSGQLDVGSIEPWLIWLDGRGVISTS